MKLNDLIAAADAVYPDGCVAQWWDAEGQRVFEMDEADVGDTLARFIAVEISETYQDEDDDAEKLSNAAYKMKTAAGELGAVSKALERAAKEKEQV